VFDVTGAVTGALGVGMFNGRNRSEMEKRYFPALRRSAQEFSDNQWIIWPLVSSQLSRCGIHQENELPRLDRNFLTASRPSASEEHDVDDRVADPDQR
jgi:hypothetical protein